MLRVLWMVIILSPVLAMAGDLMDKLTINGDFRGRYEITDYDEGLKDRERFRVRLRVQGMWKINDAWKVGARLVTGNPEDGHSTHETLEGFDDIEASFDRAFLQYHKKESRFLFGKFAHPFRNYNAYKDLVWDSDIQPEGLAYEMVYDYFYGSVGYYIIDERSQQSDIKTLVTQVGGESKGPVETSWAIAYYLYSDLEGNLPEDMNIMDAQTAVTFPLGDFKGVVGLQYILNTETQSDQDTTVAGSFSLKTNGRLKRAYVQYQKVEEFSIFRLTAGDDFLSPANFEGMAIGADVKLWKNMALHAWAMSNEPILGDDRTDLRYRLDLNVKF